MTDGLPRSRSVGLSAASAIHTQRNGDAGRGKKKRPVRPSNRPALSSMHAPYTTYTRERGELLQRCSRCADRMLLSLGGRVQRRERVREEERGGKREAALSPSRTALNTSRHSHALPARRARFLACCLEGIAASGLEGGRRRGGRGRCHAPLGRISASAIRLRGEAGRPAKLTTDCFPSSGRDFDFLEGGSSGPGRNGERVFITRD